MEKEQTALIEQLKEATEKYESLKSRFQEEIVSLEAEIKMTVEYSKVSECFSFFFIFCWNRTKT